MPFSKPITDPSGVVSTYWVITSAHADFGGKNCMVALAGWLDQNAYTNNLKPSARRPQYFQVPFTSIPSVATSGNISMVELYDAVAAMLTDPKSNSPLAGATLVA
jgi:hypothetical protein